MILSRTKPASSSSDGKDDVNASKRLPKLSDFLETRDYIGALTLLEFNRGNSKNTHEVDLWIGYCAFHLGEYSQALKVYQNLSKNGSEPGFDLNLACCYFFLGMYSEVNKILQKKLPDSKLKNRLLLHLANKCADEAKESNHDQKIGQDIEDKLSVASLNYLKGHYQEALDIYKAISLDHREYLAVKVYQAYCYYKTGYLEKAQEVLHSYLQHYPDSPIGINLKACIFYQLYDGKAAEAELKNIKDKVLQGLSCYRDLVQHNSVVFQRGGGALQILPPLVGTIPEARLNLVIYYILQDDVMEAYNLMKDVNASEHSEYILKGIIHAIIGHKNGSREEIEIAQQFFQAVGNSASERDTVQGREYIMNKKPQDAWELYLKMEASPDSFNLLQLIANDCYRMGHFYHAAKAFDMLERFDPNPEYWEGKRGACIGMFQKVVACEEPKSILKEAIQMLKHSNKSAVDGMVKVMKLWAKENRVNVFS